MDKKEFGRLKERLLTLLKNKAIKKGRFVLSSGRVSNYYLDGRLITLSAEGVYLVARIMLKMIDTAKIDTVGGPTIGADPILGAMGCLSHICKSPIQTFIVRNSAKGHGTKRQIEGPALKKGAEVILIDDVTTSGKSLIEAKAALSSIGVKVKRAIVVVDRCEGARENLAREDITLESIFKLKELGV